MTDANTDLPLSHPLRPADLSKSAPTRFELIPEDAICAAIADSLGIGGLRKLRFKGELVARGKRDWVLKAHLGATVVQDCVVTLAPVTTRVEEDVARRWVKDLPELGEGDEIEIPEDDTLEPLGDIIDLGTVLIEALALALPLYPRADGAMIDDAIYAEPGVTPMTDEAARPFAGLASLRDKLTKDDSDDS